MGNIRKSRQQNGYTPSGARVPGRAVDAAHNVSSKKTLFDSSKGEVYDWAKDPEFQRSADDTPPFGMERPRPTGRGKVSVRIDPILEEKWGPGAKGMIEDTLRGKKRDGN
jgi:hypothetical protein